MVALISGGKDSLFSILHCQANGHNVVALANLHPRQDDHHGMSEDLESYMYQTIGHAVIPLYEQALGLPLYRQEIIGAAVNHEKNYGPGSGDDETESLLPLLKKVIAAHPEVNAVSTGAILSDYQRTRVESIALRLGLTPLSYLWQWPTLPPQTQTSLLEDMAAVGQDSRIIKVASGGLDDGFLWQNVADRRTIHRLSKAAERFGNAGDGAVLGEGGEFETLAVSGPAPLWKGRIAVAEENVEMVPGDAGSASVRISNPTIAPIEEGNRASVEDLRIPPVLESRFQDMIDAVLSEEQAGEQEAPAPAALETSKVAKDELLMSGIVGQGSDAGEQARSIMDHVTTQLKAAGQSADNIAYTIIVLRDVANFAAVNAVYGSYFTKPNPPARLTIACADVLPDDAHLAISMISSGSKREGLHVQSRSYWAPANIGPYSQAIRFPPEAASSNTAGSVYIAGQIPLDPASMELPPSSPSIERSFAEQAVLALQHLDRIGRIMAVKQWVFGIAFVTAAADDAALATRAKILHRAWKAFHQRKQPTGEVTDESEDFDVWHLTHDAGAAPWRVHTDEPDVSEAEAVAPRLVVIKVDSLPRGSDVEWVGHGRAIRSGSQEDVPVHLQNLLHSFRNRIISESAC